MIKLMSYEDDKQAYMKRAHKIVEIYNQSESSLLIETLNLKNPSNTLIIYSERDQGGLLMDYHKEYKAFRLMFAAFTKENRGKGLLSQFMNFATQKGIDIAFVEVSPFSKNKVWKHLGYTIDGFINWTPYLSNRELK
jgi:hypothetical protein